MEQSSVAGADGADKPKEPSLGPACLVLVILSLALFCAICAFGSWFMFSDQYPYAIKGIQQQLIPWVESSQLAEDDQQRIIARLNALLPVLQERTIDKQQLTRLHNCLQDNPVLLWGAIQQIEAAAGETDLTTTEQSSLIRVNQRLLRSAAERHLGRTDLEFTFQHFSKVREDGQSVEVVGELTGDEIREYMKRAERLVERFEIPNEPYEKSPAEAFDLLIQAALKVD